MNVQILGAMVRQGCVQKEFPYLCELLQIALDENIRPNNFFLRHLDNFYTRCARAIDARVKDNYSSYKNLEIIIPFQHPWSKTKSFKKEHMQFCDKYRTFQEEFGIAGLKLEDAIEKLKERPYQQYKEPDIGAVEPLKNEILSKKQKIRKYIKKIKIKDLKDD